ncbi:sulfotransferase 2B1-like isoform X1 [Periophthalmus magnuspinnatus]|uniref:sulfotransferase 2B1-like isoform X1 n=1 Tax=Periophthalmus magnuspinnatus TaxID=409849 RepID=UPI0024370F0C|nr:sulfotransferase 2B1-like isoform X1 [Periophthalmus magnuspinnatus]
MADPSFYHLYQGMYVPKFFYTSEALKRWEDFTFRPDDVIVATYPKSGTNWALEIAPLVLSGGDPSVVNSVATWERTIRIGNEKALSMDLENLPSPRIFGTHFHYHAMPKSFYQVKPKVINVLRNPKDILVSAFHYYGNVEYHANPGTLTEFLNKFLEGNVPFGSWFDHVKGWLNPEDKSHILYLSFEEMLQAQDLRQEVRRTAEFLEKPLEEEVIDRITDRCLFKNMKKHNNKAPSDLDHSKFFRKGIAGDWKNHLSEEDAQHFDCVYKDKMKDVDFKFAWD